MTEFGSTTAQVQLGASCDLHRDPGGEEFFLPPSTGYHGDICAMVPEACPWGIDRMGIKKDDIRGLQSRGVVVWLCDCGRGTVRPVNVTLSICGLTLTGG